jgi:thiosulfate/3-mercaptopyruvate sulfurtransferase
MTSVPTSVDAAWLNDTLHTAPNDLVVIDATVYLDPNSWGVNSGRVAYDAAHIDQAVFIDLVDELSDPNGNSMLPDGAHAFALPTAAQFETVMRSYGIGNDTAIVTYDTANGMWAARMWWMLRVFGHTNVGVLNGGYANWVANGLPVTTAPARPRAVTEYVATFRPELYASTEQVLAATKDDHTVVHSARRRELFLGLGVSPLDRVGRIPGSVNLPSDDLLNEHGMLRPPGEIRQMFAAIGVTEKTPVISYCGLGINACLGALALHTIGIDTAVYDGSIAAWIAENDLPTEVGEPA